MIKVTSIDEYISQAPESVRERLKEMRTLIAEAAPQATEAISYGLATFKLNGNLVHFGNFKDHIGFYPGPEAIVKFEKELTSYDLSKGTIRIPMSQPLPRELITQIVKFRVEQNLKKK